MSRQGKLVPFMFYLICGSTFAEPLTVGGFFDITPVIRSYFAGSPEISDLVRLDSQKAEVEMRIRETMESLAEQLEAATENDDQRTLDKLRAELAQTQEFAAAAVAYLHTAIREAEITLLAGQPAFRQNLEEAIELVAANHGFGWVVETSSATWHSLETVVTDEIIEYMSR